MRMNVAYACNSAYIEQTGISMISLLENNEDFEEIMIYFIDMGVSNKDLLCLNEIVDKYHRRMQVINFSEWEDDLKVDSLGRHIESVYVKIFFGRINDIDRILYLDSDTIVTNSLMSLWAAEYEGFAVAGVETVLAKSMQKKLNISKDSVFINDGIVLMNLVEWRKQNFEKKCLDYIHSWNGNPPILSEGTINSVCKDKIYTLALKYNITWIASEYTSDEIEEMTGRKYYGQEEIDYSIKNPCIVHFAGAINRPWYRNSCNIFNEYYYMYKKGSRWENTPLIQQKGKFRLKIVHLVHKIMPKKMFLYLYNIQEKRKMV